MPIEFFRVGPENTHCLQTSDPDIFDHNLDQAKVAAFVAAENHVLIVARENGSVLGQIRAMIHLQPDGPNQLYIDNLGVAPSHLRQGIATRLLEDALRWGKAKGCEDAWVATEVDNRAARNLYRRFMGKPEQKVSYFQLGIP